VASVFESLAFLRGWPLVIVTASYSSGTFFVAFGMVDAKMTPRLRWRSRNSFSPAAAGGVHFLASLIPEATVTSWDPARPYLFVLLPLEWLTLATTTALEKPESASSSSSNG